MVEASLIVCFLSCILLISTLNASSLEEGNGSLTHTSELIHCIISCLPNDIIDASVRLSWVKDFPCNSSTFYVKRGLQNRTHTYPFPYKLPKSEVIHLPHNLGGETTSYVQYIVDNYDNLPELMVFLQAYPINHFPENNIELIKSVVRQAARQKLSYLPLTKTYLYEANVNGDILPWVDLIAQKALVNISDGYIFPANGLFFASREGIHSKTLDFYTWLYDMLTSGYSQGKNFVKTGEVLTRFHHGMERSWWFICGDTKFYISKYFCKSLFENHIAQFNYLCHKWFVHKNGQFYMHLNVESYKNLTDLHFGRNGTSNLFPFGEVEIVNSTSVL